MNGSFSFYFFLFVTIFGYALGGDESAVEEPAVQVAQLEICSSDSDQVITSDESASDSDQAEPVVSPHEESDQSSDSSPILSDSEPELNSQLSPDVVSDSSPDSPSESSSDSNSDNPEFEEEYFFGTAGLEIYGEFEQSIEDLFKFKQGALDRKNVLLESLYHDLMSLLTLEASFAIDAYVYFQKFSIEHLVETWNNSSYGCSDDEQEKSLLEENVVKALDKLENMVQNFYAKKIARDDAPSKIEAIVQLIQKTRKFIMTDVLLNNSLNAVFVYHFCAFKRGDKGIKKLFFALIDLLPQEGSFGYDSNINFDEEDKKELTEEWEKTEFVFEESRNQRAEIKQEFFQALHDLENVINGFRINQTENEELRGKVENVKRLLVETRKEIVGRHCVRF